MIFEGTFNTISAIFAISPPFLPVNAIVFMPLPLATLIASITFLELPDVESPTTTSPFTPIASNWREKIKSCP